MVGDERSRRGFLGFLWVKQDLCHCSLLPHPHSTGQGRQQSCVPRQASFLVQVWPCRGCRGGRGAGCRHPNAHPWCRTSRELNPGICCLSPSALLRAGLLVWPCPGLAQVSGRRTVGTSCTQCLGFYLISCSFAASAHNCWIGCTTVVLCGTVDVRTPSCLEKTFTSPGTVASLCTCHVQVSSAGGSYEVAR